ncbi:sigma-Y antisigma factor component [Bacillus aquiflavi]|uniref:Sigma-Y antisigma factor component n=1 Tax=Bacillus aquiflavi TaxID=2672567 RepID=A0A6B3VS42_9BACI|nr:sigma-Y antisigma factor component [Bacillus aquiflavi]MBA4535632.1 sigma-Y antisigma factor component [Bacillus aquiflavi]NEY80008.1 sigma-Y antisigma factor component [Bacillus aquiflavi]
MNKELPPVVIVLVIIVLLAQSLYLFFDARKNGHNYWLWGILGLIQAPTPLLIYFLFIRKKRNNL